MCDHPDYRYRIHRFLEGCGSLSRRKFLAGLSAAVSSAMVRPASARESTGSGLIHLRVFDRETGEPTPARFHLQLPDGSHWTPVSRSSSHHHSGKLPDVLMGQDFQPMLAPALARETERVSLRWTHLSRGEAVLEVPAGKSKIFVSRGFEYLPLHLDLEVAAGKTQIVEESLSRWINMPSQGVFGGDIHQHFTRRSPEDNQLWEALARAEDLHVINTMVLKHGEEFNRYEQYAYGREGTHQRGHYVIVPGQEFRDNDMSGHVTMAGVTEIIPPVSTGPRLGLRENFPPFAVACRQAREQGAVVGWAHGAVSGDWGGGKGMESVSVEAALGLIDFLEVVQFMSFLGKTFWYRLLGAGIPLAGVGGSDFPFGIWLAPWYPSFGQERTFVHTGEELTPGRWFEGIRQGRVFASNGPMLWFEVEGSPAGSQIQLSRTRRVSVKARARSAYPLETLEVLMNGEVVEAIQSDDPSRRELSFDGALTPSESCWLAVRTRGRVRAETFGGTREWPLIAHSGPIYLIKQGKSIAVKNDLEFLLEHTLRFRDFVRNKGIFLNSEQETVFLANVDEAISIYREKLRDGA